MHSKSALTRFANSQIHQNVDEESADVFLTLHNDSKTVTMSTNLTALKIQWNLFLKLWTL